MSFKSLLYGLLNLLTHSISLHDVQRIFKCKNSPQAKQCPDTIGGIPRLMRRRPVDDTNGTVIKTNQDYQDSHTTETNYIFIGVTTACLQRATVHLVATRRQQLGQSSVSFLNKHCVGGPWSLGECRPRCMFISRKSQAECKTIGEKVTWFVGGRNGTHLKFGTQFWRN